MKRDATTDVIGKSAMNRALWRTLPLVGLAYALFEIPSNLMLVRFGARKWSARIMITWGLMSAAMMFVRAAFSLHLSPCRLSPSRWPD
jgi:hypothetical protein